ncbi:sphingomyelin phosphodiesterase 3, neutral membrane (neutral sphingomyelinase II) [Perkinsus chesapeaki]|uniref:Sphingomyelin phosphodiesterase 3, neutral membrane (Neutral sphingomyelinase II) n=1 Tax=Perkinsus chesapeaki TaxID=330153 RepID=A0A7J6MB72_PERCH|nr:sphingomyelin phosphodiesterase 3, neutral membrane (neutral sphingomyelinase II) [Perkinsus chesapeaki]
MSKSIRTAGKTNQRPPTSPREGILGIMTFNTWLIPVRANFPCCLDFDLPLRAKRVSDHITESVFKDDIDIVALQEVWSGSQSVVASCINCLCCCRMFQRGKVLKSLKEGTHLHYHTKAHGTWPCECTMKFLDSGLMVMSKWPIITEEFSRFTDATSEDSFASKGALCVVLDRGKDLIIVVTTHMDAGDDATVKLKQLGPEGESLYALTRKEMEEADFTDSWAEFARQEGYKRPQSFVGDWSDLRNSIIACYGATNDQSIPSFPTRLDYIWASRVAGAVQVEVAPGQQQMDNTHELKLVDVKVADATLWRGNLQLRNDIENVECPDAQDCSEKKHLLDEYHEQFINRTSDHASLTTKVRLKKI